MSANAIAAAGIRLKTNASCRSTGADTALPTMLCVLRGKMLPVIMEDFTAAPIFENNNIAKMRLLAAIGDSTGRLPRVTIWDAPGRAMLKMQGADILALWETCETADGQGKFLEAMNKGTGKTYDFGLELVVREWEGKFSYQVNVNSAVDVSEPAAAAA